MKGKWFNEEQGFFFIQITIIKQSDMFFNDLGLLYLRVAVKIKKLKNSENQRPFFKF